MTLYRAGALLDAAAKRLDRLITFMMDAAEDEVLEQWPDGELERIQLAAAARAAERQCAGVVKNGKNKGERCSNDGLWPFDRCYSHLSAGEQDRHRAEQARDAAEQDQRDGAQSWSTWSWQDEAKYQARHQQLADTPMPEPGDDGAGDLWLQEGGALDAGDTGHAGDAARAAPRSRPGARAGVRRGAQGDRRRAHRDPRELPAHQAVAR